MALVYQHRAYDPGDGVFVYWQAPSLDLAGAFWIGPPAFGTLNDVVVLRVFDDGAGGGGLVQYADFAACLAAAPTAPNPTFFEIAYSDVIYGTGTAKGVIINQKISLLDFLPMSAFGGTWSSTDLTGTNLSQQIDGVTGYTRFVKTSGNATAKDAIFQNSNIFESPELTEIEFYVEDTSASGDRLFGFGLIQSDDSNVLVSGTGWFGIVYKFGFNWNIFIGTWNNGSYSFSSQTGLNNTTDNNKFNPGKICRMVLGFDSMRSVSSANRATIVEPALSPDKDISASVPAGMLPAVSKSVKLGMNFYSYTTQVSIIEPRRIKFAGLPATLGSAAL